MLTREANRPPAENVAAYFDSSLFTIGKVHVFLTLDSALADHPKKRSMHALKGGHLLFNCSLKILHNSTEAIAPIHSNKGQHSSLNRAMLSLNRLLFVGPDKFFDVVQVVASTESLHAHSIFED